MPNFYNLLLFIHVLIGAISLVLFWVPIATRKGSLWHRRAGRWYANAMYTVSITAFVMTVMLLIDPVGSREPGNDFTMAEGFNYGNQVRTFAVFLMAISILVFASVRHGILTLRSKKDHSIMRSPSHLVLNGVLVLFGVGLVFHGASTGQLLFYVFAGICIFGGSGNLRYCLQPQVERMEWMIAHMGAMIGAGIGSYTAFFVFGGNQYFAEFMRGNWQLIPWVAPAVIGISATAALTRKYRKQFSATQRPAKAV